MVALAPTTKSIGFCSRDPIGYLDSFNSYMSLLPLRFLDPTGTSTQFPEFVYNGCGNRPGGVSVSIPSTVPPVIYDPALDNWNESLAALNHVCFKIDLQCTDSKNGPVLNASIEFSLVISVPQSSIPLNPGIYGHELQHQLQMLNIVHQNVDSFTSRLCGLQRKGGNCKDIAAQLATLEQELWNTVGPAYTHNFPGSNSPGPPWRTPVNSVWPNENGNPVPVVPPVSWFSGKWNF